MMILMGFYTHLSYVSFLDFLGLDYTSNLVGIVHGLIVSLIFRPISFGLLRSRA